MADTVKGAEGVVEGIGVFADAVFGMVDAQAAQVCGTGRADVRQVGALVQVVAADFGGVHGCQAVWLRGVIAAWFV